MYDKGYINKNRISINKDNIEKRIKLYELQFYLDNGWSKGSLYHNTRYKKCINNGVINKIINKEDIQFYLDNGWVLGNLFLRNRKFSIETRYKISLSKRRIK